MCSEEGRRKIRYGKSDNHSNELSWAWSPIPSATTPDRCSRPIPVVAEGSVADCARVVFSELPNVSGARRENSVWEGREISLGDEYMRYEQWRRAQVERARIPAEIRFVDRSEDEFPF